MTTKQPNWLRILIATTAIGALAGVSGSFMSGQWDMWWKAIPISWAVVACATLIGWAVKDDHEATF